jgi:hypothetical protein
VALRWDRIELEIVARYNLDISQPLDPFQGLPAASAMWGMTCPVCEGEGWIDERLATA